MHLRCVIVNDLLDKEGNEQLRKLRQFKMSRILDNSYFF